MWTCRLTSGGKIETMASDLEQVPNELLIDLTLVMAGFEFEAVWAERREFRIEGVKVPTARLLHTSSRNRRLGARRIHSVNAMAFIPLK